MAAGEKVRWMVDSSHRFGLTAGHIPSKLSSSPDGTRPGTFRMGREPGPVPAGGLAQVQTDRQRMVDIGDVPGEETWFSPTGPDG